MTATQSMDRVLQGVLEQLADPSQGLPDPVFNFALRVTPMINVDLLVRNETGEHLLAWRVDRWGSGWHIPGGIIRFNEPIARRIAAVAEGELSTRVRHPALPADIKQLFGRRGHFISLLYVCELEKPIPPTLFHQQGEPQNGQLGWIKGAPDNLYDIHKIYTDWLEGRPR